MATTNIEIVLSLRDTASNALKGFGAQLNQVAKQAQTAASGFKNKLAAGASYFVSNLQSAGLVVGGFLASLALLGKNLISVGSNFEQANVAFTTMLGSADKARVLLKDISEFARTTPFELPQVVEGAKRLLAYNVAAEDIIPTFKTLGDVAAGLGTDKLDPLITAFGQIKAKGRLMGQELLQLREAGFNLADAMGITNEKLEDLVADKAIKFEDVAAAFKKVTSEGGKFFNLMDKQSKTVGGRLSNLSDNFTRVKLALLGITESGEIKPGGLFDRLTTFLEAFLKKLDEAMPKIQQFFSMLSENELVLKIIGGALLGLIVLAIGALIAAVSSAIPIIAAFAAGGALIVVAFEPVKQFLIETKDKIVEFWEKLKEFVADVQTKFEDFKNKVIEIKDNVVKFFTELKDGVVGVFTDLRDRVKGINDMTLEDWAYFLGLMVGRFEAWWPKFKEDWGYFWEGLKITANEKWDKTKEDWGYFWQGVQITFNEKKSKLGSDWHYFWEGLKMELSTQMSAAGELIKMRLKDWQDFFSQAGDLITGIVKSKFENMKLTALKIVSDVIDGLNKLIDKIGKAIEKFNEGKKQGVKGFQTGGIVPGPIGAPQLAVVHGGEEVLPNGVAGKGGNGSNGGLAIHLHVGTFLGTNTELRNFARQLYGQLALVAQAQNKTVAELMGA